MIKIKESNISTKEIIYEFPIRVQLGYSDYENYDYRDYEGYFNDLKVEAEADWTESNMTQYLPDDLSSLVSNMTMECDIDLNGSGKMICHIICIVSKDFSMRDVEKLKNWITGQMSDGWGEGFEQREIAKFTYEEETEEYDEDEEEYYTEYYDETGYVYGQFWWSDGDWKIEII